MAEAPPIEAFLESWQLEFVGRPVSDRPRYPGTGDVAFVRQDGAQLVLKTIPAGTDEEHSGAVLAHWEGHGAVRVIRQGPGAVLVERAMPGEELVAMVRNGDDEAATDILCDIMTKLRRPSPEFLRGPHLRSIGDWSRGFERNRDKAIGVGMPADLIAQAQGIFMDLWATQAIPIVLHGDLQHYNVVRDAERGWLTIDPKGVLGEPAYETGAMLRNPLHPELCASPAIIERRARQICRRLGYAYDRVIGWCFSQWVLSVLWAIEDNLPYAPDWLTGPLAARKLL